MIEGVNLKRPYAEIKAGHTQVKKNSSPCLKRAKAAACTPITVETDTTNYLNQLPNEIFNRIIYFVPNVSLPNFICTSKENHARTNAALIPLAYELGFTGDITSSNVLVEAQKFIREIEAELLKLADADKNYQALVDESGRIIERYASWNEKNNVPGAALTLNPRRTLLNLKYLHQDDVFRLFKSPVIYQCPKILAYLLKYQGQFIKAIPSKAPAISTESNTQQPPAVTQEEAAKREETNVHAAAALKLALEKGNAEVCHLLLDLGAASKDFEAAILKLAAEKDEITLFKRAGACFYTLSHEEKHAILLIILERGNQKLFNFVEANCGCPAFQHLLKNKACFFAAARGGNVALFQETMKCLQAGVDETFPSSDGSLLPNNTALYVAIEAGQLALVKWLLANGARRDVISIPLIETILEKGHAGTAEFLLNEEYKPTFTPNQLLYRALLHPKNATHGVLNRLIFLGANVNYSNVRQGVVQPLSFVIQQAALSLEAKIILIAKLIALGANPYESRSKRQSSPLKRAIDLAQIEAVKEMLKALPPENFVLPLKELIVLLSTCTLEQIAENAKALLNVHPGHPHRDLSNATAMLAYLLSRKAQHGDPRKLALAAELIKLGASPYEKCIESGGVIKPYLMAIGHHDWELAKLFLTVEPLTNEEKEELSIALKELLADRRIIPARDQNGISRFADGSFGLDPKQIQIAMKLLDLGAELPLIESHLIKAATSHDLLKRLLANQRVITFIEQNDPAHKLIFRLARVCLGAPESLALLLETFKSLQNDTYLFTEAAFHVRQIANLAAAKYDPNHQDPLIGQSLLVYAYCKSLFQSETFIEVMEQLAFQSLDLEQLDHKGQALIHYVVKKDSSQPILRALLAISHTLLYLPDQQGKTLLQIAEESGSKKTAAYLKSLLEHNSKRGLPSSLQTEGQPKYKKQKTNDHSCLSTPQASPSLKISSGSLITQAPLAPASVAIASLSEQRFKHELDPLLKKDGKSYLYWALKTHSFDVAKEMINKRPGIYHELIHELILDENLEMLSLFNQPFGPDDLNNTHPVYGYPLEAALKVKDVKKRSMYIRELLKNGAQFPDRLIYALLEDPDTCSLAESSGIFSKLEDNQLLCNLLAAKFIEVANSEGADKDEGVRLLQKVHEGGFDFHSQRSNLTSVKNRVLGFLGTQRAQEMFAMFPRNTLGKNMVKLPSPPASSLPPIFPVKIVLA